MSHMTAEEFREMLKNKAKRQTKYHNRYVYVYADGMVSNEKDLSGHGEIVEKFDGQKEYRRKKELELLERAGKISDLRCQVPLLIKEGFRDAEGKKQTAITYYADFTYYENGKYIVEDVKGVDRRTGKPRMTEAFRLKWKLLKERYPEYVFKIY